MITEENNLPDVSLTIPRPIPKIKSGGISLILRCAKAKINEDIVIPITIPRSLDNIGNNTPRKIISSNNGANTVVVKNKRVNDT